MALNLELDSVEDLDEPLRDLYEQVDEGKYRLKVDGLEDTGALKRAKDHEKQARKAAEEKAKEAQSQLDEIQRQIEEKELEAKKAAGDDQGWREAMEKSWQDKLAKRENEYTSQIDKLQGNLRNILVDKEAIQLASELAVEGSADILVPHITKRLGVDEKDGRMVTVVLDDEGRPSALTLDELKAELASNKAFAPVIVGSKATGGGAAPSAGGGASHQPSGDLSKMTRQQKLEYFKQKRGT